MGWWWSGKEVFYLRGKPFLILLVLLIMIPKTPSLGVEPGAKLIIVGESNYPPYEYVDEDGKYRGFNVDLMNALALDMGIEIVQEPMDWVSAHTNLQNGTIDAIQGMNYNEARKVVYDFSDEYLINSLKCFVRKDEIRILGIDSLKRQKVAVQRSDFAAYALADIGEIELIFFSTLDEAFDMLLNKEVDAVVGNKLTGQYIIQKNRVADDIKMVGNDINYTSYGMAFKKGNEELVSKFNKSLENLKKQGTYYKIYEKWFGKEIKPAWKDLIYIIYLISFIMLIILIISFILYKFNNLLRSQVNERTMELIKANKELEDNHNLLLEEEKYKEQIINGIGNGLITFDSQGDIITMNKGSESILGIDKMSVIGKKYYDTGLDNFFDFNMIKNCIEDSKEYYFREQKHYKGNREVIISNTIRPLYNIQDENIGAVLTFNDITEITNLRQRFAETEKMNSLGAVVSGISHEIRNPLTSIKTYIELLPTKYESESFRQKISTQVPLEIDRLNGLLKELIDYAKPKVLVKEIFKPISLLNQTIELLSIELSNKNIGFNYLDEEDIWIFADKQQIKQVFINILINSIDAVGTGGHISLEVSRNTEDIMFSIIDNGLGIDSEVLKDIFVPFYTTKKHGSGLGLSLCYKFINDNDGIINITSKANEWTRVDISFPIIDGGGE